LFFLAKNYLMWYAQNDFFIFFTWSDILKVFIENDACIGCGLCVSLCSDVFKMNDSGKSEVKKNNFVGLESEVKQCAESCPVNAIKVEE